jgi:2',3'-cyclic-nucleotide 2'-phosphodiesterase (5'-nucleotidase family)
VGPGTGKADRRVEELVERAEAPYRASLDAVIGYSTVPLYRNFVIENTIDTLILDALQWKMPEVDIIMSNGFRFCPPRATPDHTGMIPITEGYLFDMLPIDARLKTGRVKGSRIWAWLETELNNVFALNARDRVGGWMVKFRGMEVEFLAYGDKGARVKKVRIGGSPLDHDRTYVVCSCEREGDPEDALCRLRQVEDGSTKDQFVHATLREYFTTHGPVTPIPRGAAKALDVPPTLLSQVRGVDYHFR